MSDNIQFDFNDINFTKPEAPKNENSSGIQFFDFTEVGKEEEEEGKNQDREGKEEA